MSREITVTQLCQPCQGRGQVKDTKVEIRGGRPVESTGWQNCTACGGSGRVPA